VLVFLWSEGAGAASASEATDNTTNSQHATSHPKQRKPTTEQSENSHHSTSNHSGSFLVYDRETPVNSKAHVFEAWSLLKESALFLSESSQDYSWQRGLSTGTLSVSHTDNHCNAHRS